MCMARVFLLALWMASSAASATRMGSLSLARQPVRPAVLRRPIVLRRTTVLTSSLQDQQIVRATIYEMAKRRDALIQQLPVDGAVSRDDARTLDCLERALNANRHALDALSNHQTVNEALIGGICLGIGYALVVYLIAGTAATAAPVEEPPRDREAKSEYSPTTLTPTAPPAPAQAPVPIPPRQLGLPPGSVTPPRCSPTVQYRGQRRGSVEEQDYCHQQGCEQDVQQGITPWWVSPAMKSSYEVQQGRFFFSRQDLSPTRAPPASAMSYHLSYKGACEVGPRFAP